MDNDISASSKKDTTLFSNIPNIQLKDFRETFFVGKESQIEIRGHRFYNSQNKNEDYTVYLIEGEIIFLSIEKALCSQEEIDTIVNQLEEKFKAVVLFENYNNIIMSLNAYEKIIKKGYNFSNV
ncbi:hypothetical protein KJQ64_06885 [Campylobacter lari]|nr:hypothetical protein [Campylobacter lari]MBT0822470.1 hypothetical protein [Campylobacter lari]MBT0830122.1 hypothetical protein [Campylobacter lari]